MLRQYNPQRFRYETIRGNTCKVGTDEVGAILNVRGTKVRVEAWIPRDYAIYDRGQFQSRRVAGGHLALVRNLRTNRQFPLSDAWLLDAPAVEAAPRRALRRAGK